MIILNHMTQAHEIYDAFLCPRCEFFKYFESNEGTNIVGRCKKSRKVVKFDEQYSLSNPPPECTNFKSKEKRGK